MVSIRNKHNSHQMTNISAAPIFCGQDFLDIQYGIFYAFYHKKEVLIKKNGGLVADGEDQD